MRKWKSHFATVVGGEEFRELLLSSVESGLIA
jgi:hypothetical protein